MTAPLTYQGQNGTTYTRFQPKPTLAPLNSLGLKTPVMGVPQIAPTPPNTATTKAVAQPTLNLQSLAGLTPGSTPPATATGAVPPAPAPPNIIPPPPVTGQPPATPGIQDQGGSLMLPANPNGGPNPATPSTPATGTTPAPSGPTAGSSAGDVASISSFGPSNDLLYSEIDPATGQRLSGTQSAVDQAAQTVQNAPNLSQAAVQQLDAYISQTDPQYQADLRAVGEKAAALGRVGAGMTTNELTDVSTQRERDILNAERSLAGQTAQASNTQNLQNLAALSGLESQQYGEGADTRNELRTERGYEQGTDQNALNQNALQLQLQDELLNSAFNRNLAQTGQEASTGFSQSPTTALLAEGGYYGDLGAQAGSSTSSLLNNIAYLQAMKGSQVPSVQSPVTVLPQSGSA